MILAIDIGGTHYKLGLVDAAGGIHQLRTGSTDRTGGADWMIARLNREAKELLEQAPAGVRACGIGFGGPVDFAAQRILSSTHVAGWNEIDLPGMLKAELGLPAVVENDANAGALGELRFGAGQGCRHLVYLTISTGIGGGIIIDGSLYRGAKGQAGERGHLPVLPGGPRCDCGNQGCLEALASGKSIGRRAEEACAARPERGSALLALAAGAALSAETVFAAAGQGDPLALELVDETCRYLGLGLAMVVNTLSPELIVLGGGVSRAGEALLAPLRQHTAAYTMPAHRELIRVEQARHPDEAVLLGAAALARTWVV
ncbi:MAG: ROK family protein [Candidatus Latescibacteria bacterium]|nr:ROK family protein [Candidatus Latescibacterota bacterium]